MLGHKQLAWHSVEIPEKLPKPDYLPLTAGYRRAPALQLGADVYCDTALIVEQLEALAPDPSLYPGAEPARTRAQCQALVAWAETVMMRPIALFITARHADRFDDSFHADRAALHGKPTPDRERVRASAGTYEPQAMAALDTLEAMLGVARHWLLDDGPSLADIALYQAPWFLHTIGGARALPAHYTRIPAWADRVAAIGHGSPRPLDAADALALARAAEPAPLPRVDASVPEGISPGERVVVTPFTERSPATGELVMIDAARIVIAHEHVLTGRVHVHFPRQGYRVRPSAT